MTSVLLFQPPLVRGSDGGNAPKQFPITLRLYSSKSDKSELYRLRYRSFRDAGWINEDASGEFADRFDGLASSFSIGASHKGDCVGSLRLAFGGIGSPPRSMPCEEQFSNVVRILTASGHDRFVEFSRLAVEPTLRNNSFRTTLCVSLVRAGFILSYAARVDAGLIAVHEKLSSFYQRMFGFKLLGTSSTYADILEPTHLLGREFLALDSRRKQRSAFFAVSDAEIESGREVLAAAQSSAA